MADHCETNREIKTNLTTINVPYIYPANQAPGIQTGHAPGVISSYRLVMENKNKKIFFSETMRPTAYIFSM